MSWYYVVNIVCVGLLVTAGGYAIVGTVKYRRAVAALDKRFAIKK